MEDGALLDSDLISLVVQLCTRIGMIIEDIGPLALVAAPDGLKGRVSEMADAIQTLSALVRAAELLLEQ